MDSSAADADAEDGDRCAHRRGRPADRRSPRWRRTAARGRDEEDQLGIDSCRVSPSSSRFRPTLIVALRCGTAHQDGRPIADSAAATVRMKNTNTCRRVAEKAREGHEVDVHRQQHQLDAISSTMTFLRLMKMPPRDAEQARRAAMKWARVITAHLPVDAFGRHLDDAQAVVRAPRPAPRSGTFVHAAALAQGQRDRRPPGPRSG